MARLRSTTKHPVCTAEVLAHDRALRVLDAELGDEAEGPGPARALTQHPGEDAGDQGVAQGCEDGIVCGGDVEYSVRGAEQPLSYGMALLVIGVEQGVWGAPLDDQGELPGEVVRSEEHTSELQSRQYLVCRLLLEKN